jgi:ABC-type transport system substrate-binding protein
MAFFGRGKPKKDKSPKILKFGLAVKTRVLDPSKVQDNTTALVLRQVFETPMIAMDDRSEPLPLLLAETPRSRILEDGREEWTARVRKGIVFSDGTVLDATLLAQALAGNDVGGQGASVTAEGNGIKIVLERPNPLFLYALAAPYSGVSIRTSEGVIGTGPFKLASHDDPNVVRLVRNERFRDPVALDEIHFIYFEPDEQGRPTGLREGIKSGEIHITNGLPRDDVADLPGIIKSFQPGNSTSILHFNTRRLTDRRLRRALAMAIDRSALARCSYENPLAFSASGLLPPMFGSFPDGIRESLQAAKTELLASEQEIPERLTLVEVWAPRQYIPHPRRVSSALVEQIGQLGIAVDIIETRGFDDFYDHCRKYDYDMVLAGWISDTPHAADFLEANLGSNCIPEVDKAPGVRFNLSGFSDDEVDRSITELKRGDASALERIRQRLSDCTPLLPLLYGPSVVVHQPGVKGYVHHAVDSYRIWEMDIR